jgi:hypothetical protein
VTGPLTGEAVPSSSAVPHSPQNFVPGAFGAPQLGHPAVSRWPHSPQNLRLASFSVPQIAQIKPSSPPYGEQYRDPGAGGGRRIGRERKAYAFFLLFLPVATGSGASSIWSMARRAWNGER